MVNRLSAAPEPWISPGGAVILTGIVMLLCGLVVAIVELRKTRVSQSKVEHEVRPNTGGSMRDAVDKATASVDGIGGKLDRLSDIVHGVDLRLTRVETLTEFRRDRDGNGK